MAATPEEEEIVFLKKVITRYVFFRNDVKRAITLEGITSLSRIERALDECENDVGRMRIRHQER